MRKILLCLVFAIACIARHSGAQPFWGNATSARPKKLKMVAFLSGCLGATAMFSLTTYLVTHSVAHPDDPGFTEFGGFLLGSAVSTATMYHGIKYARKVTKRRWPRLSETIKQLRLPLTGVAISSGVCLMLVAMGMYNRVDQL